MCVIMKILLQMYVILDALHILCTDIQSVIVQMLLLYLTHSTPFFTRVLQLSVCVSEYPCGVSVLNSTRLLSSTQKLLVSNVVP